MATETLLGQKLTVQIVTSRKRLHSSEATEVVLPAFDGEVGILPQHERFIGTLGTGPMKVVREGKDYWFAICEGVYEVQGSTLTVLARDGIEAEHVDAERVRGQLSQLESQLNQMSSYETEHQQLKSRVDYLKALLEAHRRHALVH
jgi:F-type H+-transporting ATPase subunit epsilon